MNRQKYSKLFAPVLNYFVFCVMEGDRDSEEDGDWEGDEEGEEDGNGEGDVEMERQKVPP
jgi:hypothetical protein